MATPFIGQILIFSFNFAPKGWAMCNGQLLPINQNQALFSILGTTYGGDGRTTFGLPDLRGRVPVYVGQGITLGEKGGEEAVTLNISQMPAHNHIANGTSGAATTGDPTNNNWATSSINIYSNTPNTSMSPACLSNVGGSQPHENRSPFLVINICIALVGIFPSQN